MGRRLLLVAFLALLVEPAPAQTGSSPGMRTYAVLSLVGDALNVVTYQRHTGSSADTNRRESIPISDGVFDNAALMATETTLRKIDGQASVVLLAPSWRALYTEQQNLFSGAQLVIPEELVAALKSSRATHLVLITKHRGDARLKTGIGTLGTGKLEGLGFYVDHQLRMTRADTGEVGQGFLAPFAYIRFSLVEVATLAVLREEFATATATLSAARSGKTTDPWDVLTPAQKVDVIKAMVVREVNRAVPILVKASR